VSDPRLSSNRHAVPPDHPEVEPVAPPVDPRLVRADVSGLPESAEVVRDKRFSVLIAETAAIPSLLEEICRTRELTFREVGEGTGRSIDRDPFDDHYLHAVLWDRENARLAGGYRIGLTDRILPCLGGDGLYCSSLFQFEPAFLDLLDPGVELGRSFVAPGYQRMVQPLALLWRGIGHFLAEQGRYRYIFGPVSISSEYTSISKHLMVEFLTRERRHPVLAGLITPRNPYRAVTGMDASEISAELRTVREVSARIADSEPDGKGIPILLKHYLKLNATLLSFNVDPAFSHALDALLLVDVTAMPSLLLRKYFGEKGAVELRKRFGGNSLQGPQ